MSDAYVVTTTDQRDSLRQLVRSLPGILTGRLPDVHGIAQGFKARIGYTLASLIAPNFKDLGRGKPGVDGTVWPALSPEYLAYGHRFGKGEQAALRKQAGVTKAHRHAPGDKKGLLTIDQLRQWRRIYADRLAWYIMRESDDDAKAHAAAIAWIEMKKRGAKTKLEVYGKREVQILVDTGRGKGSLQPGVLYENGPTATYQKPGGVGGSEQIFEEAADQLIFGTNVKYMASHHKAKNKKRLRRLWPSTFPREWWGQILGTAVSGLIRISELFGGGKPI